MPGYLPGLPGLAAFAAVKFGGYCLAGVALKKLQPTVTASVAKIAGARTGLGILIGPPVMLVLGLAVAAVFPQPSQARFGNFEIYVLMYVLRIFIWALVIHLFTKEMDLSKSKLWTCAALGAVWSCLLDLPGVGLAVVAPGKIPIC
jgi:hypothetical protein